MTGQGRPRDDRRRGRRTLAARIATLALVAALWFAPPPEGLTLQAWRLFALFAAAIVSVVVGALADPDGVGVRGRGRRAHRHCSRPTTAYAGFANGTILLIVVAFLVARRGGQVRPRRARSATAMVSRFGRSTLGLSYSIFLRRRA